MLDLTFDELRYFIDNMPSDLEPAKPMVNKAIDAVFGDHEYGEEIKAMDFEGAYSKIRFSFELPNLAAVINRAYINVNFDFS